MGAYTTTGGAPPLADPQLVERTDRLADQLLREHRLQDGDTARLGDYAYTVVHSVTGGRYLSQQRLGQHKSVLGTSPMLLEVGALGSRRPSFGPYGLSDAENGSHATFLEHHAALDTALRSAEKRVTWTPGERRWPANAEVLTDHFAGELMAALDSHHSHVSHRGLAFDIDTTGDHGSGVGQVRVYGERPLPQGEVELFSGIGPGVRGQFASLPQRERFLEALPSLVRKLERESRAHDFRRGRDPLHGPRVDAALRRVGRQAGETLASLG